MPPEIWLLPSFLPIHLGLFSVSIFFEILVTVSVQGFCYLMFVLTQNIIQQKLCAIPGWFTCLCRIYMGRGLLVP